MSNNEDYARYMYSRYYPPKDTPPIGTGIRPKKENLLPEQQYHSNTTDNNIYAKYKFNNIEYINKNSNTNDHYQDFNPEFVGPDFNMVYGDDVSANGANGGSKRKTAKSNTTKKVVKKSKKVNNAKKPATKKPASKKPVAKKPATKKPATKKPATKKPAAKKSATAKSKLKK